MTDQFTTSTKYTAEMEEEISRRLNEMGSGATIGVGLRAMVMFQVFLRDLKSVTNRPFDEWDLDYTIDMMTSNGVRI